MDFESPLVWLWTVAFTGICSIFLWKPILGISENVTLPVKIIIQVLMPITIFLIIAHMADM